MSDAPTQSVRVHIISPTAAHAPVELMVDPAITLHELLARLLRQGDAPVGADWAFRVGTTVLQLTDTIRAIAERFGSAALVGGTLQLFLFDRASLAPAPSSFAPPGAPPQPPPPRSAPRVPAAEEEVDFDDEEAEAAPRSMEVMKRKQEARARHADEADGAGVTLKPATERRATVRYYTRMNPDRMFPLLVILSQAEIAEIVKAKVKQAVSEAFKVEEGSAVEVEPVLPGCDCYPPRHTLAIDAKDAITETFWVVPRVLGRVHGARVLIRQGDRVLADVPLDVKVAKQTLAVACGLLSLAAPYMTMGLKSLKLDYESQKADGFPLYQQAGNWVAENLRPEWLGLGFLGLAFVLYLWMRPRRRDVFWDIQPAKP